MGKTGTVQTGIGKNGTEKMEEAIMELRGMENARVDQSRKK